MLLAIEIILLIGIIGGLSGFRWLGSLVTGVISKVLSFAVMLGLVYWIWMNFI